MEQTTLFTILIVCFIQIGMTTTMPNIDLSTTSVITIQGASCDGRLDTSISYVNDINADGMDDLIVGAYLDSPLSRTNAGSVYVLFGPLTSSVDLATITIQQGFKIMGAFAGDSLGNSVKNAGDINSDGIADIIIGAANADPLSRSNAGCAYVIYGQKNGFSHIDLKALTPSQGFKIMGASVGDSLGVSVSNAGDFNNDGIDDILIGAPNADPSRVDAGITYVIFGHVDGLFDIDLATLNSTQGIKILGGSANDSSGISVSYAEDINNDTISDIIIGASKADAPDSAPRVDSGMVYVIFGKSNIASDIDLANLSISQGFSIWGDQPGDNLGVSVSNAGDFNTDGISDVIIGAYLADPQTRVDGGSVYVLYGRSSWTTYIDLGDSASFGTTQGVKLRGGAPYDNFGISVNYVGDINNDGIDDVFAGGLLNDPAGRTDAGSAYLVYGGSGLGNIAMNSFDSGSSKGFEINGVATNDNFGIAVSYAGNLNGIAANNLLVKAKKADGSGTVYLLAGQTLYDYWDGTQSVKCNKPLQVRKASGLLYCDFPCNATAYLYWDGSCRSSCSFPLVNTTIMERNFCEYPCSGTEYLFPDGTCSRPCDLPLEPWIKDNRKYCIDTYFAREVEVQVQVPVYILVADAASSATTKSQLAWSLMSASNPSATFTTGLLKMFLYLRYLNITTTPTLMDMYNNSDTSTDCLDIAPNVPQSLKDHYQYPPLEYQFAQYAVSASFLVNNWNALISIGLLFGIFNIFLVLDIYRQRKRKTHIIWVLLGKVRIILQNFTLQQFYSTFGDVVLFTVFELQGQSYSSFSFNTSFCICLAWNLIGLIILAFHLVLIGKYQKIRRTNANLKNNKAVRHFVQKYAGFTLLFEEFKDSTCITQSFLFIFVARTVFVNMIISLMYNYPLAQIIILTLSTIAMLTFLIAKRPHRKAIDLLQEMSLEILFLIVNLSLFELAILDVGHAPYGELQYYFGEMILYCNLFGFFVPITFMVLRIALALRKRHKRGWKGGFRVLVMELIEAFTPNPEIEGGAEEDEKKYIISENQPSLKVFNREKLPTKIVPANDDDVPPSCIKSEKSIVIISPVNEESAPPNRITSSKSNLIENQDVKPAVGANTLLTEKMNILKKRTKIFLAFKDQTPKDPSDDRSKIIDSTIDIGSTPSIFSQETLNGIREIRASITGRLTRKLTERSDDMSIFPDKNAKGLSSEDEGIVLKDGKTNLRSLKTKRSFF